MAMYSYSTDCKKPERGDIFYVDSVYQTEGSEQRAGRPAIIVSNSKNNETSPVVEVVYLTTQSKNDLPTHVDIRSSTKSSTALCEQIDSVSKTRLGSYMTSCTETEMAQINIALAISLGLDFDTPKKVVVEKPAEYANNDNSALVKAQTERDIYKQMYQDLLAKLMDK